MKLPPGWRRPIHIADAGGRDPVDSRAAGADGRGRFEDLVPQQVSSHRSIASNAVIQASMTALSVIVWLPRTRNTCRELIGTLANDVRMFIDKPRRMERSRFH